MKRYREDRPADLCFARGTFNAHPYVMGAMKAFLDRMETPAVRALYNGLDERWNDWAARFNACVRNILLDRDHAALFDLAGEDARLAVPTPEHYWPLFYIAAQQTPGECLEFFNDHIEYGAIGMLSCRIGPARKAPS